MAGAAGDAPEVPELHHASSREEEGIAECVPRWGCSTGADIHCAGSVGDAPDNAKSDPRLKRVPDPRGGCTGRGHTQEQRRAARFSPGAGRRGLGGSCW